MMHKYRKNSPEAAAQILAMMIIADGKLIDSELDVLDRLNAYQIIGISREGFARVVEAYCADLLDAGNGKDKVHLVDRKRIDQMVDLIDDPKLRLHTSEIVLNILGADGHKKEGELVVFRHLLDRWGLSLDALRKDVTVS